MGNFSDGVRFGVHSGQQYGRFDDCVELWRRAEDLGYDLASLFDHLRPPLGGPGGPCLEGTTLLAALAVHTTRIRCMILVSAVTWRHPALTANIAATIDHVCRGRLEFGMGAGGPDLGYGQYGIAYPDHHVRLSMLDEACQVVRGLWTQEEVSFSGEHFHLDRAYLNPKPLQERLPIVVGGESDGVLRVAARHADLWNTLAVDLDEYRRRLDRLDNHCRAIGRDPSSIKKSITFRVVLAEDRAAAARRMEHIRQTAHPSVLREYLMTGTPDECVDVLSRYREAGVTDFMVGARPPIDWETVELLARQVAPVMRG